jgi:hypothetical protein
MNPKNWRTPIYAELFGISDFIRIRSTEDALKLLAISWPDKAGEAYRLALHTCRGALEDRCSVDMARADFISALEESYIFYLEEEPSRLHGLIRRYIVEASPN